MRNCAISWQRPLFKLVLSITTSLISFINAFNWQIFTCRGCFAFKTIDLVPFYGNVLELWQPANTATLRQFWYNSLHILLYLHNYRLDILPQCRILRLLIYGGLVGLKAINFVSSIGILRIRGCQVLLTTLIPRFSTSYKSPTTGLLSFINFSM